MTTQPFQQAEQGGEEQGPLDPAGQEAAVQGRGRPQNRPRPMGNSEAANGAIQAWAGLTIKASATHQQLMKK